MRRPRPAASRLATTRRRAVGSVAAVVATLGLVTAPWGAASAADEDWELGWTSSPEGWEPFVPGAVRQGGLEVANHTSGPIRVHLGVLDVVDDENGCLEQERRSPLEDCDHAAGAVGTAATVGASRAAVVADGGELGGQLLVTVRSASGVELFDGPLSALGPEAPVGLDVSPGARSALDVEVRLPGSSTNETMTDRVAFTLRATATAVLPSSATGTPTQGADATSGSTGTTPAIEVLGVQEVEVETGTEDEGDDDRAQERDGVEEVVDSLPQIGSPVGVGVLALGGVLVVGGTATCLLGRARRRTG